MRRSITITTALTILLLTVLAVPAIGQRSRTPKTETSSPERGLTLAPSTTQPAPQPAAQPSQPAPAQPVYTQPTQPSRSAKKRVMVMDFDYSGLRRWWTGEWDIGRTLTTRLFFQLSQTGVYDVLEAASEKVLTDQQDRSFNERRDPDTAARVGKLKSANVVAIGTIMNFDIRTKNENRMLFKTNKMKGVVEIYVRLVDVDTGQVIGSAKAVGESKQQKSTTVMMSSTDNWEDKIQATNFEQTVLGEASNSAIEQIVQQLVGYNTTGSFGSGGVPTAMSNTATPSAATPATRGFAQQNNAPANSNNFAAAAAPDPSQAALADISGNQVIINVGSRQGVKVGSVYSVKRFERDIVDPQNKSRIIRKIFREVGRVKITKVDADSADGEIVTGKGLQLGDILELAADTATPTP
ncbi:MAG: CsgG/HfaB family protein [Pyrinomonadaceae bacterium]